MKNEWDIVTGAEYDYLGHFARPEFLARGHNTVTEPPGLVHEAESYMRQGPAAFTQTADNDDNDARLGHTVTTPRSSNDFTYSSGPTIGGTVRPNYDSALANPANATPANDN